MITIPTHVSAEKPKGAPFLIVRQPFRFGEHVSYTAVGLDDDKIFNWPMVYILANSDFAYVGETTSIASRMNQHGANEEKRDFETINIIFNEEFNTSVIKDYENRLIGYMHADGRYQLTNKNDGMEGTNYFSKAAYEAMFEDLWEELRNLELAEHTIADIEESEVFKYSPFKGLTVDQRIALDKIKAAIDNGLENAEPIVVEGMPGTGKTVLAVYLLKMLKDDEKYRDMNVRIIEPVTSLRNTLKKSLASVKSLSREDIIAPTDLVKSSLGYVPGKKKCFDIVLVDEAHKMKRRVNLGTQYENYDKVNKELGLSQQATQIDWVLDQAKLPIFFYDPLQNIGPSCIGQEAIRESLGKALEKPIKLESQMRVKGGDVFLKYILNILEGKQEECQLFDGYDFVLHEDFADFIDCFERDYQEHNLTRMVAGYAWKWASKSDPDAYDIVIDGIGLKWNCTYDNWVGRGVDNPSIAHEVGCIHSIQGYDLSYAYVIVGDDLTLNNEGIPAANKASYYDRNGFATASQEELTQYIRNIYYVLLTRGIVGTHVYVKNPILREYFAKFFSSAV